MSRAIWETCETLAGETASAIVIRTVEFSETSLVVTLWTREFGRLSALAKGARRAKGPFEGSLDLLSVCRVVVIRKPQAGLDLLTEAKLNRRFRGGEKSLPRTYAGYYVAEMLRLLTDDHDPHADLYDLTIQTLSRIDGAGCVATALLHFDAQLMRILGLAPGLERCTHCGGDLPDSARMSFSLDAGGLVCTKCRPLQRQLLSIRRPVVVAMRQLLDATPAASIRLSTAVYSELRAAMNRYVQTLAGSIPRMQAYLPNKLDSGIPA